MARGEGHRLAGIAATCDKAKMVGRGLALLLLLLAAGSPAGAQAPEELRCIYDVASEEARDTIGRAVWEHGPAEMADAMVPFGRVCFQRYRWDRTRLELAASYAIGMSAVRYLRARLSGLGIAVDSWDAVYDSSPVEIRTGTRAEGIDVSSLSDAGLAAIHADPNARNDPDIVDHSAAYFGMRATIERSERGWAALPPPR
jgi:hypothetical protein